MFSGSFTISTMEFSATQFLKTSSAARRFPQVPGLFWELGHLSTFKEVMVKYGQSAFQGARRARDIAFGGGLACTLISFSFVILFS